MDTRTCPKCGAENAKSRLTCEVCAERLSAWQQKGTDKIEKKDSTKKDTKAGKPIEPIKKDPTKGMTQQPAPEKKHQEIPPNTTDKTTAVPPEKKVIKRRKRHTAPAITEPVFFMFKDDKLIAVNVRLFVSKPIKSNDLPDTEKKVIAFINRNMGTILSG